MKCRHCATELNLPFVDLGTSPPSNAYLVQERLHAPERWYPLRVMACHQCWLVQTEDYTEADELFDADYAYFSAFSTSWLAHCEQYTQAMVERCQLNANSHVVEVAANDGYLLQYFKARGIPCLGVEPTASTAAAARQRGIDIIESFFGESLAKEMVAKGLQADLMAANNVLAHVPNINDFVKGFATLLKPHGTATFEFPHLLKLVEENQFDTIYHEHYSYLSLHAVQSVFSAVGLTVVDVEELHTHGGSLRVYAQRSDYTAKTISSKVGELLQREVQGGLTSAAFCEGFQTRAEKVKYDFLKFLIDAKQQGHTVVAYGAAAKGNTLMNFAGVRSDLIQFVVDKNPAKQNKFMPGSRIPIVDEQQLASTRPNYIVILPWNIKTEVMAQLDYVRQWGGQFVTAVPTLRVES